MTISSNKSRNSRDCDKLAPNCKIALTMVRNLLDDDAIVVLPSIFLKMAAGNFDRIILQPLSNESPDNTPRKSRKLFNNCLSNS